MLPLLRRPSLKDLLRHTREAAVCEMDLSHQRVMRDGGVLRIQPLQVRRDCEELCVAAVSSLVAGLICRRCILIVVFVLVVPSMSNGVGRLLTAAWRADDTGLLSAFAWWTFERFSAEAVGVRSTPRADRV